MNSPHLLAAAIVWHLVSAQEARPVTQPALWIEGVQLSVGMDQAEALAKLKACCRLTGGDDSFFIRNKNGPPHRIVGAIWFKNGRVNLVRSDRAYSAEPETVTFALSLFRLLSDMTSSSDGPAAIVETVAQEFANGSSKVIRVRFATGRTVEISIANADEPRLGNSVDLYELVEKPASAPARR